VDEVVPVASESAYQNTIAAVGRDDLLVQVYTTGIGHGSFTLDQILAAIRAIDGWSQSERLPHPRPSARRWLHPGLRPAGLAAAMTAIRSNDGN